MNRPQQIIIGIVGLSVLLMSLFPPYRNSIRSLDYHFIGTPKYGTVDLYSWLMQFVAIIAIGCLGYWIASRRR